MSPARRQRQSVHGRPRSEVVVAAAVGTGIVLATALLVWLMRPGPVGVPGRGGLLSRQPRMTLLVLASAAALGIVVAFVLRRSKASRLGARGAIAAASAVVVVLAVVAGIFWPGGVVRHWPKAPKPTEASLPSSSSPATTPRTRATVKTPTTAAATTATTATGSTPTTTGG